MRRPPLALIAIIAGLVVTIGVVAAMFAAGGGPSSTGYLLPTVGSLATKPSGATPQTARVVMHDDGCAFVTIGDTTSYAIWPKGFSQDKGVVIDGQGKSYGAKKSFEGTIAITDRATAVQLSDAGDTGAIGGVMTYCLGDKQPSVAIITSIP